jgi:hypothetical protein
VIEMTDQLYAVATIILWKKASHILIEKEADLTSWGIVNVVVEKSIVTLLHVLNEIWKMLKHFKLYETKS